jgi:hypothetical protein
VWWQCYAHLIDDWLTVFIAIAYRISYRFLIGRYLLGSSQPLSFTLLWANSSMGISVAAFIVIYSVAIGDSVGVMLVMGNAMSIVVFGITISSVFASLFIIERYLLVIIDALVNCCLTL